jgi:hypothetical protein
MSERGTFVIDRSLFDHPIFQGTPYCKHFAWVWLVAMAAYVAHRRWISGVEINLARAQVAASSRFMAKKWGWSEARVRRFLARLKSDAMIDVTIDAGVTVITIRNYDRYQRPVARTDAPADAPADAAPTQQRRKEERKEEKKEEGVGGSRKPLISPEAFDLAEAFAKAANFSEEQRNGLPYQAQVWIACGYDRALTLATGADIAARHGKKPLNYYATAIQRVHEERASRPAAAVVRPSPPQTRGGGGFAVLLSEKHQEAANATAQ